MEVVAAPALGSPSLGYFLVAALAAARTPLAAVVFEVKNTHSQLFLSEIFDSLILVRKNKNRKETKNSRKLQTASFLGVFRSAKAARAVGDEGPGADTFVSSEGATCD